MCMREEDRCVGSIGEGSWGGIGRLERMVGVKGGAGGKCC